MVVPPDTAYGSKGSIVLGISWAETALALVLVALRAKTAAVCPSGHPRAGILGLRWDFIWVIIALVGLSRQTMHYTYILTFMITHQGVGLVYSVPDDCKRSLRPDQPRRPTRA